MLLRTITAGSLMVLLLTSLVVVFGGREIAEAQKTDSSGLEAASGSNRFIVWEDSSEVYFKRSTDSGATWKPTVNLSNNPGDSEFPQIVVSGSGVYVTWRQHPAGFTSADVFFRGSTDNGATWGAKINISSDSGAYDALPQIAASGNSVYITWHDAYKEVFVRHSANNGVSWQPKVNLSSNPGLSTGPEIAAFESNVYVTWYQEESNAGKGNVFLRISKDSGASWGPKVNVSNDNDTIVQLRSGDPDIAASGGKIYLVWSDGGFIEFRASTDNGATWKSIISISDNNNGNQDFGDTGHNPQIVVSGSNIHVTWVGNCCDIFYKRSTDGGVTWKSFKNLSNTAQNSRYQTMAVSGSNVYVTWIESVGGGEVMFRRSIDNGATWKWSKNLSSDASICGGWSNQMAISGSQVYVVFSSKPPFNGNCDDEYGTYITDIYLKRSTDGGATWKTLQNISKDEFDSWNPQIAS